MEIKITVGATTLEADLLETELAKKITDMLPLESRPNRWGDATILRNESGDSVKIEKA
jgi:hypothetical protein